MVEIQGLKGGLQNNNAFFSLHIVLYNILCLQKIFEVFVQLSHFNQYPQCHLVCVVRYYT